MIVCLGPTPTVQRTMTFASLLINNVNRTAEVHEYASGKSINAARVLHTLGHEVICIGFVGGDRGKFLRSDLNTLGMTHRFIDVHPQTRLCLTIVDQAGKQATELIEESHRVQDSSYKQLLTELESLLSDAGMLVLSGSLTPGASVNFYAECVRLAGGRTRVIVDAAGKALTECLTQRPFLIKPNRVELERTVGRALPDDSSLYAAMCELCSAGARWVMVTQGQAPALLSDGVAIWRVFPAQVEVTSPIGSGDSLAAGLAAGLSRGLDMPAAAQLAMACGAANAMTPHAGHVDAAVVENLFGQIVLQRIF